MDRHFHTDLNHLKQKLVRMGVLVEEAIGKSVEALFDRDVTAAEKVIEGDEAVDRLEIQIDEEAHRLWALQQPVAHDLRSLAMILKINTDLERVGDHAVNIAEYSLALAAEPPIETNLQLKEMAAAVQRMLRDALVSFTMEDVELAQSILRQDDVVDQYNAQLYNRLQELIETDPLITRAGMNLAMIGHNLERIGDLANNIAEDVIYMKQGREVRHHIEESRGTSSPGA